MKLPIMLTATHDEVVKNFVEMINDKNEELARVKSDLAAANKTNDILQNRNTELNVKLTVAEKKADVRQNTIDELEDINHELHQDLSDSGTTIKDLMDRIKSLEFCNQEAKKEIKKLTTKLEVNTVAKRQIRNICAAVEVGKGTVLTRDRFVVHEKINGAKIWDLTYLIGE